MASGETGGAPGVCASAVTDSRMEFAAAVVTPVATRRRTKSRREMPLVRSCATRFLIAFSQLRKLQPSNFNFRLESKIGIHFGALVWARKSAMALISASVQSAPRPTIRYSTPSHDLRSPLSELHMLAWWHWKHFLVRISLPSAAGAAGGAPCAPATVWVEAHRKAHRKRAAARMSSGMWQSLQQLWAP